MSEKKCNQCGMELEDAMTVTKNDKEFCSDSCASKYTKRPEGKQGCC